MPRVSNRKTKGVPPKRFVMSGNNSDDGSDNQTDNTIVPNTADPVVEMLAKLSLQLKEMKGELLATRVEQQTEIKAREELSHKVTQILSGQLGVNEITPIVKGGTVIPATTHEVQKSDTLLLTSPTQSVFTNPSSWRGALKVVPYDQQTSHFSNLPYVSQTNTSTTSTFGHESVITECNVPIMSSMPQSNYQPVQPPRAQPLSSNVMFPHEGAPVANYHYQPRKLHDLPIFGGKVEEWPMFIAAYRTSTAAFGYDNIENMFRLQKCLTGEAKSTVESLMIYPDNVGDVISQLEFVFGRPEILIRSQLKVVSEIAPIDETHLHQLISFAVKIRNLTAFLETTQSQRHLANPLLMDEIVGKIPMNMQLEWIQLSTTFVPYATIKDFSNWINVKSRYVSQLSVPKAQVGRKSVQETQRKMFTSKKSSNVVLHVNDEKVDKSKVKVPICSFCEANHHINDCSRFNLMSVKERWEKVKLRRMCFSCLKLGHNSFNCRRKRSCGIDKCLRIHHQLLHEKVETQNATLASALPSNDTLVTNHAQTSPNPVLSCQAPSNTNIMPAKVLFKILPIKIFGPRKMITSYALLDEGSSVSLIDNQLARELELDIMSSENLTLQWLSDVTSTQMSSVVKLEVSGIDENSPKFQLDNIRTINNLDLPVQTLDLCKLHTKFQHLKQLPVYSYSNVKPSVLIGINNCHVSLPRKIIERNLNEPIAVKTKLGWVIYGPNNANDREKSYETVLFANEPTRLEVLHDIVKDYFTTENFGVQKTDTVIESKENVRARAILNATTRKVENKFETGLLWKLDDFEMPDSLPMAIRRLQIVEAKMRRDKRYAEKYTQNIETYLSKGYARRLTQREAEKRSKRTWFLPHFGVQHPAKPEKLRLVFDAAASVKDVSLNSMLLSGPDENSSLLSVLFKFRQGAFALCADIMEMFHQVNIRHEDQDSQRFVWRDGDSNKPVEMYVMTAMIFGSKSSPCSAQYVMKSNAKEFQDTHPQAVNSILKKHYVDDYAESFASEEEAIMIAKAVTDIHRVGGFTLRNFVSNSKRILQELSKGTRNYMIDMNMDKSGNSDKILGMRWDVRTDEFKFELNFYRVDKQIINQLRHPTKREFLSIVMSIFDPFGLLANFVVYSKLMLQEIWREGTEWDEKIPNKVYDKWICWQNELKNIDQFHIPRCYSPNLLNAKEIQLHIFVDSSESAFAAVAFIRVTNHTDDIDVSFCIGKTKCAPQKLLSVPRLELQAGILGIRLKNLIVECVEFRVDKFYFWTDSMTVLHWIRSESRRYKPFVAHRVAEILDSSNVVNWRWISTELNVADDATRAKYPPKLDSNCRWLIGPEFLKLDELAWPVEQCNTFEDKSNEELRPKYQHVLSVRKINDYENDESVFEWKSYHSYIRLKRVLAWMLRFSENCRKRKNEGSRRVGGLLIDEINAAELKLCRLVQIESYPIEYDILMERVMNGQKSNLNCITKSSKIYELSPCIGEDHVIRIEGRLINALCVPLETRQPIIMPKEHHVTELIATHYHCWFRHQNQELIICEMRRKFWVPHLRVLVKKVKQKCLVCKHNTVQPQVPRMGQLPVDRITPFVRPFTYSGLDFFGPIIVSIGRRREKRWVALFSCLTIRAVHVEIATDLSTDACLVCIRNFVNRRGIPMRIRCDNGTNFVGCHNELKLVNDFFDHQAIQDELSIRNIEWVFNCPSNPNAGGCWERQVQLVKRVIQQCLVEVNPSVETLRCFLIEAENIVNSRPLTHVPVSPEDEEPLTPNHFILGTPNSTQTPGSFDKKLLCSRKQWRVQQQLKNHFWRRWMAEFLPILTRRTKWFENVLPLKIDDLVLICDAELPRSQWLRGRIVEVYPGKDGQVRVCDVKTATGILKRPASKLAKLDVDINSKSTDLRGPGCHES